MSKRTALGRSLLRQQMGFDLSGSIAVTRHGESIGWLTPIEGDWAISFYFTGFYGDGFASPAACLRGIARELKRRKKAAACTDAMVAARREASA